MYRVLPLDVVSSIDTSGLIVEILTPGYSISNKVQQSSTSISIQSTLSPSTPLLVKTTITIRLKYNVYGPVSQSTVSFLFGSNSTYNNPNPSSGGVVSITDRGFKVTFQKTYLLPSTAFQPKVSYFVSENSYVLSCNAPKYLSPNAIYGIVFGSIFGTPLLCICCCCLGVCLWRTICCAFDDSIPETTTPAQTTAPVTVVIPALNQTKNQTNTNQVYKENVQYYTPPDHETYDSNRYRSDRDDRGNETSYSNNDYGNDYNSGNNNYDYGYAGGDSSYDYGNNDCSGGGNDYGGDTGYAD